MKTSLFKSLILSTALATCIIAPPAFAEDAKTALTKEQLQQVIHDYIMENPMVIMTSVDEYQKKTVRERSSAAIQSNYDDLYKNDATPFIGNKDGDVVVVEFFDYNCGYCKKALPELQALAAADKNVKITFKEFPILGPTSELAAKWALAAHKQEKYFEFHRRMMEHKGQITDDVLESVAKDSGMDTDKAKAYLGGTEVLIQIEKNRALASQLGITGTPAFLVGETLAPGAVPFDELQKLVNEQRKTKTAPEEEKK